MRRNVMKAIRQRHFEILILKNCLCEGSRIISRTSKVSLVKVVVVGNPCNTNALIANANSPDLGNACFSAMTRLDENRAAGQLALKAGVPVAAVEDVVIWGNHANTMYPDVSKVFYFEGVTHLTLGKRGELDVFTHMRSHGYITMGVGKLWHWEPIGEPFTRGTGAHFPKWGTYSQEWGCGDEDAGGRCSPRKEEVPDGDIVMGRVYPTKDPAESLFDYRVASDANKKLALGAKQWSMRRRPFFLGVGFFFFFGFGYGTTLFFFAQLSHLPDNSLTF